MAGLCAWGSTVESYAKLGTKLAEFTESIHLANSLNECGGAWQRTSAIGSAEVRRCNAPNARVNFTVAIEPSHPLLRYSSGSPGRFRQHS